MLSALVTPLLSPFCGAAFVVEVTAPLTVTALIGLTGRLGGGAGFFLFNATGVISLFAEDHPAKNCDGGKGFPRQGSC